jgi:hypothetical protein
MIRKTLLLALVAASIGLLAAGCGSSSSKPSSSPPASTSGGGTGTNPGSTTASGGGGGGGVSSNPAVKAAVAACKSRINSTSQLSSSLKTKLTKLCDQAGSGNLSGAKKIAAEVCKEIVNANLPSGTPSAIKDQALAACKKAA